MRKRLSAIGVLVSALALVSLGAQQPDPAGQAPAPSAPAASEPTAQDESEAAPGQTPTFRTRIDAVTLDVIVTDRQGRPVLDLEPGDFEVIENKTPQAIQTFELVQVDTSAQPESSFVHDITSIDEQQRETARPDTRILVVFLDDYHVRIENSLRIRQDLARFVEQLTSRDLVALMYPLTPVTGLTFSRNHEATAASILAFQGRKYNYIPTNPYEERYANYPPEAQEVLRNQIVTSALRGLATYLGTLREGKKQVLYVSEGMSGTLPAGMRTAGTFGSTRVDPSYSQRFFSQMEVLDDLQLVFKAAARSNTSIYTLDPRGLAAFDSSMGNSISLEEERVILNEAQDLLRTLSYNTDGDAIVNRNDPMPELQRMVAQMNAYYLLGYTSTEAPRDGKFHPVDVRVKRPGLEVRARKGYWAYSPEEIERALAPPREMPSAAVEDALARLVVPRDHAVHAWIGSQRAPDGRALVTFAWEPVPTRGPSAPARLADDSEVVDRVVLTATSATGGELFRGTVARDPQLPTPAGRISFEAPPGDVRLQFVSENARGARIDSDDAIVEVPDFTSVGPLITRPAVYRGRTVRALQLIREAETPVPAVGREFSRTERLLLRFQAYGPAGTTPAVTMRLLNNLGRSMADLPAPTQRPDGTFEAELALGSLAPGDYLIEVAAKSGEDTTQSLVAIRVTS